MAHTDDGSVRSASQFEVQPVVARIGLARTVAADDLDDRHLMPEFVAVAPGNSSASARSPHLGQWQRTFIEAAAVALGVTAIVDDPRLGLMLGSLVTFAGLLRAIHRRVGFSFGEGFIGYRSDDAWPRGIQEDDDVHWQWTEPRR
jgi:hypothetical protein